MNKKDRLVSRLYYISLFIFLLFTVYTTFIACFDIFSDKPSSSFNSMPHHSVGYPVEVILNLNTTDTLIYFEEKSTVNDKLGYIPGSIIIDNNLAYGGREEANRVINDSAIKKTYVVENIRALNKSSITTEFKNVNINITEETCILILPQKMGLKFLLIIKTYLSYIVTVILLWYLLSVFKLLKKEFIFSAGIIKYFFAAGYLILIYQILYFIIIWILRTQVQKFEVIQVQPNLQLDICNFDVVNGFNLTILFAGLCIVTAAKLLKLGHELQTENDLTV